MFIFKILHAKYCIWYKKIKRLSQIAMPGGLKVMTTMTKDRLTSFVNGLEIWPYTTGQK